MPTFVYMTEKANASVLAAEIGEDETLGPACEVTLRDLAGHTGHALGHGTIAEIAITVASGVMTTTISDALRRVLDRARDRAEVETVPSTEPQAPVTEHGSESVP